MKSPYTDPNYNPYSQSVLIATAILFIIISILAVSLRFYSRSLVKAPLGPDDWITIPSLLICIGLCINQIVATKVGGLGGHQELVDGQLAHTTQLDVYEKTKYIYQVLGTIGLWVIKLSVLLFYRRVFSIRQTFRIVNLIFICVTIVWGLAFTFAGAFQCTPVSTLWDKFEIEYLNSCVTVQPFYLGFSISDLILDVAIFLLPIPSLWKLQLPMKEKLAVGGIFLLGSIVVAIGITRVVIFQQVISFTEEQPLTYFMDITWYTAGTLLWHMIENCVALLGCCLPTYRPLFKSLLPKLQSRMTGSSSGHSTSRWQKKSSSSSAGRSMYYRQEDDESPLSQTDGRGANRVSGPPSDNYALRDLPRGKILLQNEYRMESSAV